MMTRSMVRECRRCLQLEYSAGQRLQHHVPHQQPLSYLLPDSSSCGVSCLASSVYAGRRTLMVEVAFWIHRLKYVVVPVLAS